MVALRTLKKGDYFMVPNCRKVYVKDVYDRSSKRFSVYDFDDVNSERFFKGDKMVIVDFEF